jgi:hypothetical protein
MAALAGGDHASLNTASAVMFAADRPVPPLRG